MLKCFLQDSSKTRTRVLAKILAAGVIIYLAALPVHAEIVRREREEAEAAARYAAEAQWLGKFDYAATEQLYAGLLKPCSEADVARVQQEEVELLRSHGLNVLSVRNEDGKKPKSGERLKYRRTTVEAEGSFRSLAAALNVFEKKNLVVITDAKFRGSGANVRAQLTFNTYYL